MGGYSHEQNYKLCPTNFWSADLWGHRDSSKAIRDMVSRVRGKNHAILLKAAFFYHRKLFSQTPFYLLKVRINTDTCRQKKHKWGEKRREIASLMHSSCCPEPFPFACAQWEPFLSGQRTPFRRPLVKQGQMHPSKFPPVMKVIAKEEDKAEPHLIRPARQRPDLEAVGGPPP